MRRAIADALTFALAAPALGLWLARERLSPNAAGASSLLLLAALVAIAALRARRPLRR